MNLEHISCSYLLATNMLTTRNSLYCVVIRVWFFLKVVYGWRFKVAKSGIEKLGYDFLALDATFCSAQLHIVIVSCFS